MEGHVHKRVSVGSNGKERIRWYVVIDVGRGPDGRRKQKWHGGFRTRKEAEAARAKIVSEVNAGTYIAAQAITFDSWVREQWLPAMRSQVKVSTWDSYRRNLELHVLPRLGARPIQQITVVHLNGLYAELLADGRRNGAGGLSPKTVRYVHTIVHKVLGDAFDASLVSQNVAARAKPPRPRAGSGVGRGGAGGGRGGVREMKFWTPSELSVFLGLVREHRLGCAFHLAAMTGMRRGEVLGLRWRDVSLDLGRLSVRHTLVSVAYEIVESTPKTHQARVIDLDAGTVALLGRHRVLQAEEQSVWGTSYADGDLVFCREDGAPLHPDSFSQAFERLVARSGLPRIRLHDLRHTHATIALRAGVPVKVISERLGHESSAFTMKQYAHVIPGMQAEAAAMVAKLVEGG